MADSPDVIVVGGGVIGLSIAWRLSREGVRVTLCERDRLGSESSWAGAGVLSPCNPHRRDAVADLRRKSLALYPNWCAQLHEQSGIDPEYERCGELEIALNENALRSLRDDERAGAGDLTPEGAPAYRFHDPAETRRIEPMVCPDMLGSLECRDTAQVRNPRLLRALVAASRKRVSLLEQTRVTDLRMAADRVTGVVTQSDVISCHTVIVCAGAWSSQIGERLGRLLPVIPVRGQMILMKFDSRPFRHVVSRGKTYLVPRRDGHVLLGATEEHGSGFVKRNTPHGIRALLEVGMKLVPAIAQAPLLATWAGLRPGTPDDHPYLGLVPGIDGLIVATGHFRSGIILAPITAEIVCSLALRGPPVVDISPFRVDRSRLASG